MSIARRELKRSNDRHPFDPWRIFVDNFPHMVNEAMDERFRAAEIAQAGGRRQNHRNFNVATSVVAVDPAERSHLVTTAPNTKPKAHSPKVCSETRAIGRARKALNPDRDPVVDARIMIIGMVVIGEPQADDGTGYKAETLWCCELCRQNHLTADDERRDTEADTLVATLKPDARIGQIQTSQEMVNFQNAVLLGEDPVEINPFLYRGDKHWDEAREMYDTFIPSYMDTLASPQTRASGVYAARTAIQGYMSLKAA